MSGMQLKVDIARAIALLEPRARPDAVVEQLRAALATSLAEQHPRTPLLAVVECALMVDGLEDSEAPQIVIDASKERLRATIADVIAAWSADDRDAAFFEPRNTRVVHAGELALRHDDEVDRTIDVAWPEAKIDLVARYRSALASPGWKRRAAEQQRLCTSERYAESRYHMRETAFVLGRFARLLGTVPDGEGAMLRLRGTIGAYEWFGIGSDASGEGMSTLTVVAATDEIADRAADMLGELLFVEDAIADVVGHAYNDTDGYAVRLGVERGEMFFHELPPGDPSVRTWRSIPR